MDEAIGMCISNFVIPLHITIVCECCRSWGTARIVGGVRDYGKQNKISRKLYEQGKLAFSKAAFQPSIMSTHFVHSSRSRLNTLRGSKAATQQINKLGYDFVISFKNFFGF